MKILYVKSTGGRNAGKSVAMAAIADACLREIAV